MMVLAPIGRAQQMLMPVEPSRLRIAERVGAEALRHGLGNEMLMAARRRRALAADFGRAAKVFGIGSRDQALGGVGGVKSDQARQRHGAAGAQMAIHLDFPL